MSDAPERIALRWEPGKAVTSGPLMQHEDYTHYIRADHAEALVRAAYEAAARAAYHSPDKAPDYPYDENGKLKRAYRDEYGEIKNPEGYAGQIALWEAYCAAQDIRSLTVDDARAKLDEIEAENKSRMQRSA